MAIQRTLRARATLSMLAASFVVVSSVRAAAPAGPERISVATGGAQAAGGSSDGALSANLRYVAFSSGSPDLVSGDTNGSTDVFVRDRKTGTTTRVSVSTAAGEGNGDSSRPSLSANGRYVVFQSTASNLVAGDNNGVSDVFVHDRTTGETKRVSVATDGSEGDGASVLYDSCISANGRYVVFQSAATNFFAGDYNKKDDVFVHDLKTGTTTLVSSANLGGRSNGRAIDATISGNARFVAFTSNGTDLLAGDSNARDDVFVRDLKKSTTVRASLSASGGQSNGPGTGQSSISANGKIVAFVSDATTLIDGDTNGQPDVYVKDLGSGKIRRVSVASNGAEATGGASGSPSISADGKTVAFTSTATNLVTGDTNSSSDVFVSDLKKNTTRRASVNAAGQEGDAGSFSSGSSLAANGKFLVLRSDATNLVTGDTNAASDVLFVRAK
jgi:Tol biopolymer transport system component